MTTPETLSLIDVRALLRTPISTPLRPEIVKQALSNPPFIPLAGALNLRTISYPPFLKPNLIFRSGALGYLTASSLLELKTEYDIRIIYDLRSANERAKSPSPEIEGVETIWIPADAGELGKEVFRDVRPGDFVGDGGREGYLKMYGNILETHTEVFRAVFLVLRNGGLEDGGVLFHCTAGKDRTGVLSALIISLIGVPKEIIAEDYAMTRIGVEPAREQLLRILQEQIGCKIEEAGMEEMCEVRGENMIAFLDMVEERWGGVEGYLEQKLELEKDDVWKIRSNLRGNVD